MLIAMITGCLIVYCFMNFVSLELKQMGFRTALYRIRKTVFHRVQWIAAEEKSIALLKILDFCFCFSKQSIEAGEQSISLLKNVIFRL